MPFLYQLSAFRNVFPQRQRSFYLLIGCFPFGRVFELHGVGCITHVIMV